jgi:hypothetical protein
MFDVTTARQVDYTDSHGFPVQVTVFQDRENTGRWYLVPVPRLRVDSESGSPIFSLTKYRSNAGGIAGSCTFETELFSPPDAKFAAERQIPEIKDWGQFTWVSGDVFFYFELPDGEGAVKPQQIAVTPSLFLSNTARFRVELPNDAAVNTFVGAFSGDGSVSNFSVLYEMGVLTQLLGAKATIKYTAKAAIEYERTYEKKKDTWGKSYNVLTQVKQNLKQSGAGDVQVTKGTGGTDELVQMVRDWAWSSLEKVVADAIETAKQQAQDNENPISVVSDINATYSEDAIIEWSTPVSRFLPKFDAATWSKVHHEVDNRQLEVTFELLGDPTSSTGVPQFSEVECTVRYPTRTTGNTFTLSLAVGGKTSETYVAPGEAAFNPNYEYKLKVTFPDGPDFSTDWIPDSATRVAIRPNQLGIRKVSFTGSNVPFASPSKAPQKYAVDKIFIDFFEKPPAGQQPKLQTKPMLKNEEAVTFDSTYHAPITNTYDYRLRYLLKSGDVVTVQPPEEFGSNNADQIFVLSPQDNLTSLDLRAISTKAKAGDSGAAGDGFLEIDINAAYFDPQNPSEQRPPNFSWDGWEPDKQPGLSTSPTWTFGAEPDPQTAYFQLNGQVIYGDGESSTLTNVNVPYSRRALIIRDTEEIYSAQIFTDQINWKDVKQVTVNVFQQFESEGGVLGTQAKIPEILVSSILAQSQPSGAPATRNFIPYNILPPAEDQIVKSLPLYYTLYRLRESPAIVFYYNADYVLNDGKVKGTGKIKLKNKLQIHLPPVATDAPGQIHAYEVEMAADA